MEQSKKESDQEFAKRNPNSLTANKLKKDSISTVLVKLSIAEHGLPKKHRIFFAIDKDGYKTTCNRVFMECNPNAIKFYYEEVPFSSLIESRMPTKEFDKWLWQNKYEWNRTVEGYFRWFQRDEKGRLPFGQIGKTTCELLNEWLKNKLTSKP